MADALDDVDRQHAGLEVVRADDQAVLVAEQADQGLELARGRDHAATQEFIGDLFGGDAARDLDDDGLAGARGGRAGRGGQVVEDGAGAAERDQHRDRAQAHHEGSADQPGNARLHAAPPAGVRGSGPRRACGRGRGSGIVAPYLLGAGRVLRVEPALQDRRGGGGVTRPALARAALGADRARLAPAAAGPVRRGHGKRCDRSRSSSALPGRPGAGRARPRRPRPTPGRRTPGRPPRRRRL